MIETVVLKRDDLRKYVDHNSDIAGIILCIEYRDTAASYELYDYPKRKQIILDPNTDKLLEANYTTIRALRVAFDDVGWERETGRLTLKQASEIIHYVADIADAEHLDPNSKIVIACKGGVSRSASIAMFIDLWCNCSFEKFLDIKYSPNEYVLQQLVCACGLFDQVNLISELCKINFERFQESLRTDNE